ncbi:unnamed protein product [Soboliphyme baturini]|uniref:HTH_Tnp_ISL3 domain-containing protein n=1 Tax=Soboliphyme baturini TaxID=241478 RepID=A0A183IUW3_9BILA|nr:unnamed protein product [Soboliphyme baturini]
MSDDINVRTSAVGNGNKLAMDRKTAVRPILIDQRAKRGRRFAVDCRLIVAVVAIVDNRSHSIFYLSVLDFTLTNARCQAHAASKFSRPRSTITNRLSSTNIDTCVRDEQTTAEVVQKDEAPSARTFLTHYGGNNERGRRLKPFRPPEPAGTRQLIVLS